jgi:hypothetical protein
MIPHYTFIAVTDRMHCGVQYLLTRLIDDRAGPFVLCPSFLAGSRGVIGFCDKEIYKTREREGGGRE